MAPYSPGAIEMGEIVVCRDTSEGLRKGRLLSSFHCFLFFFSSAGRRRCHEIQTERWGRLHAALPHSSAALE